jgi:peptide/nickel transport system substrate-binding protein
MATGFDMNESHHRQIDVLASALRRGTVSRRTFLTADVRAAGGGCRGLACPASRARAQDAPKAGGVFRMGLHNASQNDNLDPGTWSTSWTGAGFNGGIYNNLVEILPDGSVAGDLAESWEPNLTPPRSGGSS